MAPTVSCARSPVPSSPRPRTPDRCREWLRRRAGAALVLQPTLANVGNTEVSCTLTPNGYAGTSQIVRAGINNPVTVNWPAGSCGYYDVIITANASDGFTRR